MQSIVSEMNLSSRGVVFCRLTATERGLVGGAAFRHGVAVEAQTTPMSVSTYLHPACIHCNFSVARRDH